jgi:hypothetical protein
MSLHYLEGVDPKDNTYYQQSFWELSDKDIEEIVKTRTVVLNLFGETYPPVSMSVLTKGDHEQIGHFLKHNEYAVKTS